MAVKIKLKRLGKIREPYYRIVIADARTKRDGRAIEEIGKYYPKAEPSVIEVNSERAQHWLQVGAQPTDPVLTILKITGDWQKFKGESGAEGTLRTAEPRADKKEAFAAAAKESVATKEAKESKSSGGAAKDRARSGKSGGAESSRKEDGAGQSRSSRGQQGGTGGKESPRKGDTAKADAGADTEPVTVEAAAAEEGKAADAEPGSGA
ncbi:MAG: 30S ribosomal protein S16 [Streptosporangiaceae bacterium]|nr:30S ribosomal protein S16 [Streptosporangiaceae bacterium]